MTHFKKTHSNSLKKIISLFLAIATLLSCTILLHIPVGAASISFPTISKTCYIETKQK